MTENKMKFMVCVRSLIYNHEKYINDCLRGFMMQEVNFPVVFLLEDDASTDSTSQILSDWVNTNFNVGDTQVARIIDFDGAITIFAQHKFNPNFYVAYVQMKYNHYRKFSRDAYNTEWRTSAKYEALCEGDDYWTDPLKLQKQVDFMESHEEYSMCVNATQWMTCDGSLLTKGCSYPQDQDIFTNEIIQHGGLYLHCASYLYRRDIISNCDYAWRKMADVGDFPLIIAASLNGKIRYLADTMTVYRYQHEGSWTTSRDLQKEIKHTKCEISWMRELDNSLKGKYSIAIYSHLFEFYRFLYLQKEISGLQYIKGACKADGNVWRRAVLDISHRLFPWFYKIVGFIRK